jgi:hypothetical protein
MAKQCKYTKRNNIERKCFDYFISHRELKDIVMCRLSEWKRRKKVCPYDNSIRSCCARPKGQKAIDHTQITLANQLKALKEKENDS